MNESSTSKVAMPSVLPRGIRSHLVGHPLPADCDRADVNFRGTVKRTAASQSPDIPYFMISNQSGRRLAGQAYVAGHVSPAVVAGCGRAERVLEAVEQVNCTQNRIKFLAMRSTETT